MSLAPMSFHAMPSCPGGVVSCITPQRLAGEDSNVELIVVVVLYCIVLLCVVCITDLPVVVVPFLANCPP